VKVLGIDPGTNITGYAVIEKKESQILYKDSGVINLKNSDDISLKLEKLYNKTVEIIIRHHPDSLALEDIFYYKNVKSTVKLAYAKGVIFLAAAHKGIEVFEYTPTNVKSVATGNGRATKDSVKQLLYHLIGNLPENFQMKDETDAIALAYCHLLTSSFKEKIK
jgi:crossover junction endodeoxyribonuclease RuvC